MADWWEDILKNAGNNIVTGVTNAASNPQLIPALASAYHFYNQADKYGNMGNQLGKDANPFGDRQMYRQGLDNLYANPDSIANTAAYKFKRDQGLGILGPQLAAKGGGFGNTERALIDYASGLASTEYDKEWQRLYEAAGGKFDPANAGKLRLDAAGLEANAKGAALDSLFTPWKNNGGTTVNNNNSGGTSGFKGNGTDSIGIGSAGVPQIVSAIYGGGRGALDAINLAMNQGLKYIDLGDGTKIDLAAAARSMGGTDSPGNFGTYPTDGSIGNYGPETPIETPTDPYTPMVPDPTIDISPIEDNLGTWWGYEGLGD